MKLHYALALFLSAGVFASDYPDVDAVLTEFAGPGAEILIAKTPVSGLLEIRLDGDVLYITEDGKHIINGLLFDTVSKINLTELAKADMRMSLVKSIDMKTAITFAPKSPKYDVFVFTDLDCGYCRKLHAQIDGYMDAGIAVHYLAFPRSGPGTPSFAKAKNVWCAADPKAAITDAKLGTDPAPASCDDPVTDDYMLGRKIGVTGTPAILTSDGQLIPGYLAPVALREQLDEFAAKATADAELASR